MNARKFGGLMELCGHFSKQDSYAINVRQPLPDTPCRTHCIYMLRLQHHKCHHCRKTQDAPQLVSASVPIKASDLHFGAALPAVTNEGIAAPVIGGS